MTNAEKYKTAKERTKAFINYCNKKEHCTHRNRCSKVLCIMEWLDMEFEEEPMNCLFCHNPMQMGHKPDFSNPDARISFLYCPKCGAESPHCENEEDVIPRYNEVVRNALTVRDDRLNDLCAVCHILCPDNDGYESKCENCHCRKLLLEKDALDRRIKDFREHMEKRAKAKEENERICSTCKHYETLRDAKTVGIHCKVNCELLAKHCPKWERKVAE